MLFPLILASLAFSAIAFAQTPNGVEPSVQTPLTVLYPRNITVSPPGVLLQRADTQVAPTLTAPTGTPTDRTYLVIMMDLDVPRNGGTTLLHWLQTDFTLSLSPPPGTPHRYVFWMFAQPDEFAVPESFSNVNPPASNTDRIGFNLTDFVAAAGLDAPLAGNYFTVVNSSATASSTGSASATSSPAQYTGSASTSMSALGMSFGFMVLFAAAAAGFA
ncbi:hypothetical protein EPUS_03798 [Endocarpon pusillum Z07020]|uniref:PEBP-like protein n=1 Tax=Endocarpon pusillum (strain Z07020 / HMAS-L-300199) TaxID=1263415 RepID=U1HX34_ENDPU|nr:uncharacterized protein EPUS_03798 [Endocarpon pusillum Z07020]ERF73984.1 hypothetical protein EPUS_03798 [Endocarpon pusillum Z07020]